MKTSIFVALFAAAALISGCDDKKKESDGDESAAKSDSKGGDGDLPKECEEYLKASEKCMKDMPAEAKAGMETAVKAQRDAFKAAATPEAKKALATGCKASLDAIKQNPACK